MTDTLKLRKWFSRSILILIVSGFTYVALQPHYNFAHWVPHSFLRVLGIPYSGLLWFERHADALLHFGGAWGISLLLFNSKFKAFRNRSIYLWSLLVTMLIITEVAQYYIGRGVDYSDLLFGFLGCFMAYFTIKYKN